MPARQLHLFPHIRPLLERFGPEFFRAVPRAPGIYIMTGQNQRVLYIGQSKNLRARLGSYKNAQPDRAPRKTIRLIHQVDSIVWELCESPGAARLRENELLRLHRPRFNRANVYPRAYSFLWLRHDPTGTELGRTRTVEPGAQLFGAFKSGAIAGYGALLRLLWATAHQPTSPHDFPSGLLSPKLSRSFRFGPPLPSHLLHSLVRFLEGSSDELLQACGNAVPKPQTICAFQHALHQSDLETLTHFYRFGPKRNHELKTQHHLPSPLIPQEHLDDLLAPLLP
jgi:predicted GIY-YIG superfamily endonuclease